MCHNTDIDIALFKDTAIGQQTFNIVKHGEEVVAKRVNIVEQILRQILMHTTGAEISGVKPRPASTLIKNHQLFAFFKAPCNRGQRTDIKRLRADIHQMIENAANLAIQHTYILSALGHFNAQHTLDRQGKSVLLIHRRDIIKTVKIRHALQIGFVFNQLFRAAMQQADMRVNALHALAVQIHHQTQHTMRGRMLRAEINGKFAVIIGVLSDLRHR